MKPPDALRRLPYTAFPPVGPLDSSLQSGVNPAAPFYDMDPQNSWQSSSSELMTRSDLFQMVDYEHPLLGQEAGSGDSFVPQNVSQP